MINLIIIIINTVNTVKDQNISSCRLQHLSTKQLRSVNGLATLAMKHWKLVFNESEFIVKFICNLTPSVFIF